MAGTGDGPILWNNAVKDIPICRQVTRQGVVHPTEPMSAAVFDTAFKKLFMSEYIYVRASMHMIRRQVGKAIDGKYNLVFTANSSLTVSRTVYRGREVATLATKRQAYIWTELCCVCVIL